LSLEDLEFEIESFLEETSYKFIIENEFLSRLYQEG
jgi:hypothetical protein